MLPLCHHGPSRDLVRICQKLGWLVNVEKSELEPKQVFNFVGYQFDLSAGRVRPTPDRWQTLQDKSPPGSSPAYTRSNENMPKFRLPVRSHGRSGPTYTGPLAEPSRQILEILSLPVCPVQQFMSDRFTNSHRKAISPRPTP